MGEGREYSDMWNGTRVAVNDGNPCRICGSLIPPDSLDLHTRWHLRLRGMAHTPDRDRDDS